MRVSTLTFLINAALGTSVATESGHDAHQLLYAKKDHHHHIAHDVQDSEPQADLQTGSQPGNYGDTAEPSISTEPRVSASLDLPHHLEDPPRDVEMCLSEHTGLEPDVHQAAHHSDYLQYPKSEQYPDLEQMPKQIPLNSIPQGSSTGSDLLTLLPRPWAITYTPYTGPSASQSACKTPEQIHSDIRSITKAGFSTIRLYATDCDALPLIIPEARRQGLQIILGIFVDNEGITSDTHAQLADITTFFNGAYTGISGLLIGNEALFNGALTPQALADFVVHSRQVLRRAGFFGPVGIADTVYDLQTHQRVLCPVLDVLAANVHPFFNGRVEPSRAGQFVDEQMDIMQELCGGSMEVWNAETGWPSDGPRYGESVPGRDQQDGALRSLMRSRWADRLVFGAWEDEGWKSEEGEESVEAFWGCGGWFGEREVERMLVVDERFEVSGQVVDAGRHSWVEQEAQVETVKDRSEL